MILDDIVLSKHTDFARASYLFDIVKMLEQRRNINVKSFYDSIKEQDLSFIGEIRRASPELNENQILTQYHDIEDAVGIFSKNAHAVSVVTEKHFYKGRIDDIGYIRAETDLAVLNKDFVVSPYQVFQSKIYGASAVLLVERILKKAELKEYVRLVEELSMDAVIEVQNENSLERALNAGAKIVSVNCVEYENFIQQSKIILNLSQMVPDNVLLLCDCIRYESEDMDYITASGADAVFVSKDIFKEKKVKRFKNAEIRFV